MLRYILKRTVIALITVLVLITIIFALVRMLPGDPFISEKTNQAIRDKMMAYYGLDKPLWRQWLTYVGNLLHGDLGVSMFYNGIPITKLIGDSFPYSADLGIRSLILATVLGIVLGVISALNRGRWLDYICVFIAILGVSLPDFVTGYLLQYFFGIKMRLFPIAMWTSGMHKVLPVIALSFYSTAQLTRIMRASMLEVVGEDYIKVAKAKGLTTPQIVWRHQIRNAILPIVTLLGPLTAAILTGTFVIESIYAIPGMGKYYVLGIQNLDYSQILGLTVFYGAFLVAANFAVDIIYGLVDPRIRLDGGK